MPELRAQSAMLEVIMKPDANKQHKPSHVLGDIDYYGPRCWNCELEFKSLEDAPPDLPIHFCNPLCRQEWMTRQPLQNLLDKRRISRERGK